MYFGSVNQPVHCIIVWNVIFWGVLTSAGMLTWHLCPLSWIPRACLTHISWCSGVTARLMNLLVNNCLYISSFLRKSRILCNLQNAYAVFILHQTCLTLPQIFLWYWGTCNICRSHSGAASYFSPAGGTIKPRLASLLLRLSGFSAVELSESRCGVSLYSCEETDASPQEASVLRRNTGKMCFIASEQLDICHFYLKKRT